MRVKSVRSAARICEWEALWGSCRSFREKGLCRLRSGFRALQARRWVSHASLRVSWTTHKEASCGSRPLECCPALGSGDSLRESWRRAKRLRFDWGKRQQLSQRALFGSLQRSWEGFHVWLRGRQWKDCWVWLRFWLSVTTVEQWVWECLCGWGLRAEKVPFGRDFSCLPETL